jgi:muramidase (phage lysozyme)
MSINRKAFLDMIAFAEGTAGLGEDGYNVLFGSTKDQVLLFTNYARHPGILIDADGKPGGLQSSAAGRYQLLHRYFRDYKKLLNLDNKEIYPDGPFSPKAQDTIALQQIRECRALDDIDTGRITAAVEKCRRIWASLPGAGYGQPEKSIETLLYAYTKAGGELAGG